MKPGTNALKTNHIARIPQPTRLIPGKKATTIDTDPELMLYCRRTYKEAQKCQFTALPATTSFQLLNRVSLLVALTNDSSVM